MTNYVINRSDPANGSFTVPVGEIDGYQYPWNSAFYLNTASGQTATSANSSLVLAGQGIVEYGELIQNNLMFLMEHFAYSTRPLTPTQGQIWYKNADFTDPAYPSDPTLSGLYVWTGTTWSPILAGNLSGNINLSGGKIVNLGDATAGTDGLNLQTADGRYLRLSGGSLTGPVTFTSGATTFIGGSVTFDVGVSLTITDTPTLSLHAANKAYVDTRDGVVAGLVSTETSDRIAADGVLAGDISTINGQLANFIVTTGDTMSGTLSFDANASIFALSGGTGSFSFGLKRLQQVADPTTNADAATKVYVDTEISSAISALPPSATSDGVVSGGIFDDGSGQLSLQRTLGLPDVVVVTGAMAPYTHVHPSTSITYSLSSNYNESTLSFSQTSTPGYPNIPVFNAIQELDKRLTRATRPIDRKLFTGDGTTTTFNLGSSIEYGVEENRLQVFVNGIKQYASERGVSEIAFDGIPINPNSSTGLTGVQTFNINVNGAGNTAVAINATGVFTYLNLITALTAQFTSLSIPASITFTQYFDRLVFEIFSNTTGAGSSVVVSYGVGELFTNIAASSAPVNTAISQTLGYTETGIPGDVSTTFTFASPPTTGAIIEALVYPV